MNLSILLGIIGPWEGVLLVVALLLLFGGSKIPQLMKSLGQGMKEFKKATSSDKSDDKTEDKMIEDSSKFDQSA